MTQDWGTAVTPITQSDGCELPTDCCIPCNELGIAASTLFSKSPSALSPLCFFFKAEHLISHFLLGTGFLPPFLVVHHYFPFLSLYFAAGHFSRTRSWKQHLARCSTLVACLLTGPDVSVWGRNYFIPPTLHSLETEARSTPLKYNLP